MKLPCISLHQPYASLMAIGAKKNETRSFRIPAKHLGRPMVIHAARKPVSGLEESLKAATLECLGVENFESLPFGAALCVVVFHNCYRLTNPRRGPKRNERLFGDYSKDRFIWESSSLIRLPEPVPLKGNQRIFNINLTVSAIPAHHGLQRPLFEVDQ